MDAAILFSDILMVPHGLGVRVAFQEGEGPVLEPVREAADIGRAEAAVDGLLGRVAPVFETVGRVRAALDARTTLIGFAGAPWTVATYMVEGGSSRDFARVKGLAYRQPALFGRLIDLLVEATTRYLEGQIAAGAEAIQLFDSWAGVLSPSELERWSVEPVRTIVERLRATHPEVPVIGFPKGVGANYRGFAERTGVRGVSLDWTVPLDWAATAMPEHVALQGNLDPLLLAVGGKAMRDEALRILDVVGQRPFIFNLGHGIVPETDPAHVAELCMLIRAWAG
jgi:uroporphyrinogen decarboxylase